MSNSNKILYFLVALTCVAGIAAAYSMLSARDTVQANPEVASTTEASANLAFPSLAGPKEATVLPTIQPARTTPDAYSENALNSLVILLKDTDSSWLGLAHGLKSMGVPFRVTTNTELALKHNVVAVYPSATGANVSPGERAAFYDHVQNGKTIIGFSVIGGGLSELFGFRSSNERNNLRSMEFSISETSRSYAQDQAESQIPLASLLARDNFYPGVSFNDPLNKPLAIYDDGSAAIVQNIYPTAEGNGRAIAIGIDFGHYILRAQNGRFVQFTESYANSYQPKADTLLRLLASIYKQGEPNSVLISPTAHDKAFTALLTHDVDYTQSIYNAETFAEYEKAEQVPATYFIQTKYVTDYNDSLFFDSSIIPLVRNLQELGAEIASHSVSHSNEFSSMELGNGRESYPSYRPFVQDFATVRNASIGGELRVSKFLLESITGRAITAFRPGHLALPQELPQMLQATNYKYGSSITANEALTHLPFRSNFNRSYDTELPIFEFPVTIEDEQGILGERIAEAITLTEKISRFGGLANLLIHTDITGHKLAFEQQYVNRFKESAWFTTVSEFGDWWTIRDSVVFEFTQAGSEAQLLIKAEGSIAGLTLEVPNSWSLRRENENGRQVNDRIILDEFEGETNLNFEVSL